MGIIRRLFLIVIAILGMVGLLIAGISYPIYWILTGRSSINDYIKLTEKFEK